MRKRGARVDDIQRYLVNEFAEAYRDRLIDRRTLLKRVLLVTGRIPVAALIALGCAGGGEDTAGAGTPAASSAAASSTSPAGGAASSAGAPPPSATSTSGITVDPADPAISVGDVRFPNGTVQVLGYIARPRSGGPFPTLILIHENQGLTDHIKDVARRYAKEGFVALAVDLVSRNGGSKTALDQNTAFLSRASRAELTTDLQAGLNYLKEQRDVKTGALGVTGFCLGGTYTWEIAIASPDVRAAAPYYGPVSGGVERVGATRAAVLAVYGAADASVTAQAPQVEMQLKATGRPYEVKIYPGAAHAFFNDTRARYHPESARDAWTQTTAWFRRQLA